MRTGLSDGIRRRGFNGARAAALVLAGATVLIGAATAARGQVPVPRYKEQVEAPLPQLALPMPPAITPNGTVVEAAIVRVNDQIIDNSDYRRAQQQLIDDAQRQNMGPAELEDQQKNLLRDMIDQQLLLSRGKELDINVDSDVIKQLDAIRKKNHLDTMDDLEKAVRQSGLSYEDFKANIKNQLISQQVVGKEVGQTLRLTASEEQAYYDQHKEEFAVPEQERLSEILIPTPDDATDAQVAQAQAKANDVEAKLKAGVSFADLAKQVSGGQTADTGGDLGEFQRGALAKVLEDATFSLKTGEWTAPIRTRQGFVVLLVTEHAQAGVQPLSAVDQQVQDAIYREAIQPALRKYLTDLRSRAAIIVAPGYVDTGASPKETQPQYISATTTVVKKKKVEKVRLERGSASKTRPAAATGAAAATASGTAAEGAAAAGSENPGAASAGTTVAEPAAPQTKTVAVSKKRKKIRREKIRFGQAPQNSLPAAPEETVTAGADQGTGGVASALATPGAAIAPIDQPTDVADGESPLAPKPVARVKTRYSDLAPIQDKAKAAAKAEKAKQEAALVPVAQPLKVKAAEPMQAAPLGLGEDRSAKKAKKKKVKGAPKERMQEKPPAPPAPAAVATPLPPKSIRDNGEPEVAPAPTDLPPVTVPADAQPGTAASSAASPAQ